MTTVNKRQVQSNHCNGSIGDYKIIRKLESGSQATVLLGEDRNKNRVAIKVFKEQKIFRREAKYMTQIGTHESIINLYDILKGVNCYIKKKNNKNSIQKVNAIVMEMGKIDLFGIIRKVERFTEETGRYYFKQLLNGIEHMHKNRVAHCDLKLENIIFDKEGKIKIIDFGLAHKIQNNGFGQYRKLLGTYGYMAPEIHNSEVYNVKAADVYSLGVILYVLVLGSPPFQQAHQTDAHYNLMQNDVEMYSQFMDSLGPTSNEFKDLILQMLKDKSINRLSSITQIKNHPWYSGKTSTHKQAVIELNQALLHEYNQNNQ